MFDRRKKGTCAHCQGERRDECINTSYKSEMEMGRKERGWTRKTRRVPGGTAHQVGAHRIPLASLLVVLCEQVVDEGALELCEAIPWTPRVEACLGGRSRAGPDGRQLRIASHLLPQLQSLPARGTGSVAHRTLASVRRHGLVCRTAVLLSLWEEAVPTS